ncbi:MAG: hypothetical protein L3J62_07745, partial [Gammaproteobacteria bacterium]|nr:hypothetical protein [Gammaproteobacteria bacterium]
MSSQTRELANNNWKDIWAIALPSSVVYFTVNLVNLLAIKIVANLGSDAIAAITTGARFYNIFNAMLIGLSVGTIALVSQSRGSDNPLQSAKLFNTSLLISIGLGFGMTLFMLAFTPFLVGLFLLFKI